MSLHFGKTWDGKPLPCKMTVWSVEPKEKSTVVKLTSSKKKGDSWETDFSSKCLFLGGAKDKALGLKEKDKITILSAETLVKWNRDKNANDVNIFIYDFEMADGSEIPKADAVKTDSEGFMDIPDGFDSELPFI